MIKVKLNNEVKSGSVVFNVSDAEDIDPLKTLILKRS
jgi:hypothetical protein